MSEIANSQAQQPEVTLPGPMVDPHPLRFAIVEVTDKIPDLTAFLEAQEFDAHLKAFLVAELDELESNAATINVHDVERPDGGFDLHVSVAGVNLGGRAAAVKARA